MFLRWRSLSLSQSRPCPDLESGLSTDLRHVTKRRERPKIFLARSLNSLSDIYRHIRYPICQFPKKLKVRNRIDQIFTVCSRLRCLQDSNAARGGRPARVRSVDADFHSISISHSIDPLSLSVFKGHPYLFIPSAILS